ncbi:MAG: transglutaminase domain-containing protein [Deltaproteobacteria bacterium]|nr:transglutaminase domain-containing protein [Deltaproteobacteria bacterium]
MRGRVLLLVLAAPLLAHSDGGGPGPILHEFVPEDPGARAGVIGAEARTGQNPAAIRVGSEIVAEPEDPAQPEGDEPTYSADDQGANVGRRHDRFSPDDDTLLESQLDYAEAFDPAIAPFKRLSAFDAVRPDFTLGVGRSTLEEVPVVGSSAATPDRDLFWGSVVVDLAPGEPTPIPSVAPDARILSYRATPGVEVHFLRDSADNFFVTARHRGSARLVFLTDAPAAYFGAELPADRRAADLPQGLLVSVPGNVSASALRVAGSLGLSARSSLREILSRLAGHFRAYEESSSPPTGFGNLYENLALGGKGVCRHRAYAFMVTANALGVPTRFVMNEAHAFVESFLPDTGWLRIDLGGAARGLSVHNAAQRMRHEPRRADELPQPEAYRRQYSLLRGQGVTGAPRIGAPGPTGAPQVGGQPMGPGQAGAVVRQPGARSEPGQASALPAVDPTSIGPRTGPSLQPSFTVVDQGDRRPRRGASMHVEGRVLDRSGPLSGAHVQVFLSRDGHTMLRWLGTLVTGPDGRWAGEVLVPPDVDTGPYHVVAVTPGDTGHAASMSAP